MKKLVNILFITLLALCLCSCKAQKSLPLPEVSDGVRGDLGIDKNINEENIDDYLNRDDAVYRDMRMLIDEAEYEAIGGDSYLSGFIKGFEVVPYPYLCNVEGLPEAVGQSYTGTTLFTCEDGKYVANYQESMAIIESLFPKDKVIFLMCGGGGYAGMTKKMLVALGWDETKIYNVGGYWYYQGKNNVDVKYTENGEDHYNFSLVNYHDIKFDTLTKINDSGSDKKDDHKVAYDVFNQVKSLDELDNLKKNNNAFPLFVYLSGCTSCAEFYPVVLQYVEDKHIMMYAIDMNDIWGIDNEITDRIKYAPSMFIYKDGEVLAYLDPGSNDDYDYYKSTNKLAEWFNNNIDVSLFMEAECCTIK